MKKEMKVCVCVRVLTDEILTSYFWLGTGSVSPNRTLLCLSAGVWGLIKVVLVDPPSVLQWSGRWVFAQLFTLTPQFIPVNHHRHEGVEGAAESVWCSWREECCSGIAPLWTALPPFSFLFHFLPFSCPMLTQRQQCMEGKLRLCSCVLSLLIECVEMFVW